MNKLTIESSKIIELGLTEKGESLYFDLFKFLETRLLIQASSGGGKSYLLRRITEQVLRQQVPVWIVDPEGEYTTLREKFDLIIFAADDGDLDLSEETLDSALPELLKKGVSCVFDLSDLNLEEKRGAVVAICRAIMSMAKADWKSMLLCIDEAQVFAPEGKSSPSLDAITDLASRIRKRGVGLVVATQRLSALDKNLTTHLQNRIIGYCLEDIEVTRAANYIGKEKARGLVSFQPGDFYALGAALNVREPVRFHAGAVETTHPDPSTRRAFVAPKMTGELEKLLETLRTTIEAKPADDDEPEPANFKDEYYFKLQGVKSFQNKLLEREQALIEREVKLRNEIITRIDAVYTEAVKLIEDRLDQLKEELKEVFKLPDGLKSSDIPGTFLPDAPQLANLTDSEGLILEELPAYFQSYSPVFDFEPIKDDFLKRNHRKILDTLATFERMGLRSMDKTNVAVFSGASPKSSAYAANLSFLRNASKTFRHPPLISYSGDGMLSLTDEGRALARPSERIETIEDLHQAWIRRLPKKQGAMLAYLLKNRERKFVLRTHLAQDTAQSETSSLWAANLSALRKFGLIEYVEQGGIKCVYLTGLLFPVKI